MFEFLVTLLICDDPNAMTGCKPLGQKTAIYETKRDCGMSAFAELSEHLATQGLKPEEIDKELGGILVVCQQGKRVYSV